MSSTYRVIAPKERKRLGNDFTDLQLAEDFASSQKLRPLSIVRVLDKGLESERYETVTQFTK